MLRLQVIDESAHFACGSCTACCDQPWRTLIETDKAAALDRHDFSRYPQLAGKQLYRRPADGEGRYLELAKGEGTRCIFLDADGLCIIHKELGAEAKPHMCRQFPYLGSRAWRDDRVSVNYGCPAVQSRRGSTLPQQKDEIAAIVPATDPATKPDAPVLFDVRTSVPQAVYEALIERSMDIFDGGRPGSVFARFSELLAVLDAISTRIGAEGDEPDAAMQVLRSIPPQSAHDHWENAIHTAPSFDRPAAAPMPVRFLFAATLQPDTLPPDAGGGMGLMRRLSLIPRLMSLANMKGAYASRLLGRNVSLQRVFSHEIAGGLEDESTQLLLRYFRSRLWQRLIVGTRLPIAGGVHQHLLDLAAIMFYARAEAAEAGADRLSDAHVRGALTRVEFHLANQKRLHDRTLRGWIRSQLCDLKLAWQTLRLAWLCQANAEAGTPATQ